MSYSIHMNGKSKKDAKGGLQLHMERDDEEKGKRAAVASESKIDPTQTKYNVTLIENKNRDSLKIIKDKFDKINEQRKEQGMKKLRSNKNIFLVSTLQLGNETLDALGWDRNKKREDQTAAAVKNVTIVYKQLLKSANKQPERYGEILEAHLHFDEKSPHVDMIADCLDVNDLESGAREFLNHYGFDKNGKKESYKKRLVEAQDHLADYVTLKPDLIDKINLVRGDSTADKVDFAVQTHKALEVLENTRESVKQQQEALEEEKRKRKEEKERFEREKREFEKEKKEFAEFNSVVLQERSTVMEKHFEAIDYVSNAKDIPPMAKRKLNAVLVGPIDAIEQQAKIRKEEAAKKAHEQAADDLEISR